MKRVREGEGFFAALDQSGGSTPKTLDLYGIGEHGYKGVEEMFDKVHEMRARIISDKAFDGDRIIAAILFENTVDRTVEGQPTAEYLWERKRIVPFLKVDKGLEPASNGSQLMKPIPGLDPLLEKAKSKGVFGTKMRSVISEAEEEAIEAVVDQQFELARQIWKGGLVPIVEPEVSIHSPSKAAAERLLRKSLLSHLDALDAEVRVVLKITLPEDDDFYRPCIEHDRVLRVVALSGGFTKDVANSRLMRNHGLIASFSRALTEGLKVHQSDEEFSAWLDQTIGDIYDASTAS